MPINPALLEKVKRQSAAASSAMKMKGASDNQFKKEKRFDVRIKCDLRVVSPAPMTMEEFTVWAGNAARLYILTPTEEKNG